MLKCHHIVVAALIGCVNVSIAHAQAPAAPGAGRQGQAGAPGRVTRPPLFLKEEWKQTPAGGEHPVTPESIASPNLELKLYGPASKEIQLTGAAGDENNPTHVWTGTCTSPCAVAFRDKTNYADLTGLARIRWNTKMSGFHQIRPIVKLADGTWLIGDKPDGATTDWIVSEISFADVRWLRLDIAGVLTKGTLLDKVDLSRVDEIGFADLMPGSGHGAGGWADVAQVEVYAKGVARGAAAAPASK
jgi:hypothetical protein